MEVIVRDGDTGKPIAGAKITRSIDMSEEPLRADEQGRLRLSRRAPRDRIRFWFDVQADGYVQRRFSWPKGEEPAPPAEVPVALFAGEEGGGRILDEAGRPIPGVAVLISGELEEKRGAGEGAYRVPVTTDDRGRWRYGGFRDMKSVHLILRHPDFVLNDPIRAHEVKDLAALRALEDVQVLAKGIRISGRILGPDGEGIPGATIRVASSRLSPPSGLPRLVTDGRGEFRLQARPGQEIGLFIRAPGFSPDLKIITPTNEQRLESRLMNGRPFLGRVEDLRGAPIPGASITLSSWRDYRCMDDSAISDRQGRFRIEEAPEGEFDITISAPGHTDLSDRKVAATADEQVFAVGNRGAMASGTLRDEQTGAIIPDGRLELGFIDPATGVPAWKDIIGPIHSGRFHISHEEGDRKFRLRARALGYEPFETGELSIDRGEIELDFPMRRERRPGPAGVVVDPDGRLAIGAQVVAATNERAAGLRPGRPEKPKPGPQSPVIATTGPDGRFSLPFLEGPIKFAFIHDLGCQILTGEDLKKDEVVRLQPWGRVEGRLFIEGRPAAACRIMLRDDGPPERSSHLDGIDVSGQPARATIHSTPQLSFAEYEVTDAEGRFSIDRVPPIDIVIAYALDGQYATGALAKVEPGRTTRLELDGKGRPVVGRMAIPPAPGREMDFESRFPQFLRSDRPDIPFPDGLNPGEADAWLSGWWNSPGGKAYRSKNIARRILVQPDGSFRIRDVPPGRYRIDAQFAPPVPGERDRPAARRSHRFAAPDAAGAEPLDIGTLEMQPAAGP